MMSRLPSRLPRPKPRRTKERSTLATDPLPLLPRRNKRFSPSLVFPPKATVHSRTPSKEDKPVREADVAAEAVPVVIAETVAAVVANGAIEEETEVEAAEEAVSISDPEPPTSKVRMAKLASTKTPDPREKESLTKARRVPSMRVSTRETVPEEAAEVAERVETDLPEMLPLMIPRKKPRSRRLSKRSQRSLNLNMRKSFLVKTSMTISAPSRLLVARRLPDKLRRLMLLPRLRPRRRPIKLPSNKTPT